LLVCKRGTNSPLAINAAGSITLEVKKLDINWNLVAALAAIAGIVIMFMQLKLIGGRRKLKCLEGRWFEYHWTNPDGANIKFSWLESALKATPGVFKSYKLDYENKNVLFRGEARYIDKKDKALNGDILFKVQKKKMSSMSKSTIYFRYNIPEKSINDDVITGIWLSCNFGKDITSGASILSKTPIPPDELDTKFEEYFEVNKVSIVVKSKTTRHDNPPLRERLLNWLR
jgi:hypothetical protein